MKNIDYYMPVSIQSGINTKTVGTEMLVGV